MATRLPGGELPQRRERLCIHTEEGEGTRGRMKQSSGSHWGGWFDPPICGGCLQKEGGKEGENTKCVCWHGRTWIDKMPSPCTWVDLSLVSLESEQSSSPSPASRQSCGSSPTQQMGAEFVSKVLQRKRFPIHPPLRHLCWCLITPTLRKLSAFSLNQILQAVFS